MSQLEPRGDLVKGTVEMMVLGVLGDNERHGLEIYDEIARRSEGVLNVAEGSLYPALKRMEAQGLITSEWRPSKHNRRARYYAISDAGRRRLESKRLVWEQFAAAVGKVLSGSASPRPAIESKRLVGGATLCAF